MISVQHEPFDVARETAALMRDCGGAGAIVTFVGVVRSEKGAVESLYLDHYHSFTEASVGAIAADAQQRFPLLGLRVVHRYGKLEAGEGIVFVGAAAEHRRAAFEAVDYLMDRLKTEAAFWKKEIGPLGSRWVEPSEADHSNRAKWESK